MNYKLQLSDEKITPLFSLHEITVHPGCSGLRKFEKSI